MSAESVAFILMMSMAGVCFGIATSSFAVGLGVACALMAMRASHEIGGGE